MEGLIGRWKYRGGVLAKRWQMMTVVKSELSPSSWVCGHGLLFCFFFLSSVCLCLCLCVCVAVAVSVCLLITYLLTLNLHTKLQPTTTTTCVSLSLFLICIYIYNFFVPLVFMIFLSHLHHHPSYFYVSSHHLDSPYFSGDHIMAAYVQSFGGALYALH